MPAMYFSNLHQLWTMDGHGPYVWAAYAIVTTVIVLLVGDPLRRRRETLERVRRRAGTPGGGPS